MSFKKPVLAVDVDDTIAHLMKSVVAFYSDTYEPPHFKVDDFHTLEFNLVWGGTRHECDEKVERYYKSDHFKNGIDPIAGAYEQLKRLKEHFELHVVTARPHHIREATIEWLNKHYPDLFSDFHFGNLYGLEGVRKRKSQMCKEIGAVCLIDDSAGYALDCAANKVHVLLFGNYAWNTSDEWNREISEHSDFVDRVQNWDQAANLLMGKFIDVK